ncbi:MAG: hypothetical protein HUU55_19235 [Myxococcales bacterium]|nr:hypothetical protein [Myxococcales bacterium]
MTIPIVLSSYEQQCLTDVFGPEVPLDVVRFRLGGALSYGASRTIGNNISMQTQWQFHRNEPIFLGLLVHEVVHVWQYRHVGWAYAWGALWEQTRARLKQGTRRVAYHYVLDETVEFRNYGYEQQAQMIQDWFLRARFAIYDGYTTDNCTNFGQLGELTANQLIERYLLNVRVWSNRCPP